METLYIVIKNMQVINANFSSSYLSADLSQNAYLGFGHHLARYLDEHIPNEEDDFGNSDTVQLGHEKAFAILKHLEFNQGHASFVGHLNDKNHKALNIPMNPPEIKGTLKQTVVIQLSIRDYGDYVQLSKWVKKFLLFNRFSGGDIQNPHRLTVDIVNDLKELSENLKWEKGWVAQDATEALIKRAQETDYSEAFCDFLATFKKTGKIEKTARGKDNNIRYQKNHKGWFYASLAGYQLLELPKTRQGARFNHPHAFAEPIIGLHILRYFSTDMIQSVFWYSLFENNCYLLKQGH